MARRQPQQERPKRAADDVAADMQHRLEELDEEIRDAERKARELPEHLLEPLSGDPDAMHEGQLSRGATPAAAEEEEWEDEGGR